MNDDAQLIKAALDRRFARAATPPCPESAWHATTTAPTTTARPRSLPRGFAYAAALLVVVAIGGLAAQAASSIKSGAAPFKWFSVSSKPLMPTIHAADRLTIAQAQRRISFPIVVPAGLPAGSRLLYAHVVSENPIPLLQLRYEAHIGSRYYDISIHESTSPPAGPPVAHFQLRNPGHGTKTWNAPLRRWKHGDVFMDIFPTVLPAGMTDRIVRANTM
jgi:hypothetical protein